MSGSGTGSVPGRTLGQLLIAEPAVTAEGRLSTWLAQFLVRLSGFVGPAGGNAPPGSLAAGVTEALEAVLLEVGESGMPGGPADAQLQSLTAAVGRIPPLPMPPVLPGLHPLAQWAPATMSQSGGGGVGDVSVLPPMPTPPVPQGADGVAPLPPLGGVCACLCPLPPLPEWTPPETAVVGEVRAYAGTSSTVPTKWALCYGQAVSRTTYALLFAALGTAWGVGDGSTTFNLPDLRGRMLAGVDDMGGSAANRVTNAVSGIAGTTLGAVGGEQNAQQDTLTSTSVVTDPGHTHDVAIDISNVSPTGASLTVFSGVGPLAGTVYTTTSETTGITVATTTTSALTGSSENMPPAAIVNWIIYLGV